MPLSIAFRFLTGHYHATPFGHHVNEGMIEWPPSPWRLLRALVSVGYTSGVWDGAGPSPTARSLIESLSVDLPLYSLPPTIGAHSRHYMPLGVLDSKSKTEKTTLVFDTWARIEDRELVVTWRNVLLKEAEWSMLNVLVGNLNYLGRSESWVEGRILEVGEPTPETNCFPDEAGEIPGRGWEQVTLLAPSDPSEFQTWRAARLEEALTDLALPDGKKPAKTLLNKRAKAEAPYPTDMLDCLQKDTTWLRSYGWNWPPGSRRVFYWRRSDAISVSTVKTRPKIQSVQRVEAMLLSVTNASRNDHALPSVTRTLPQGELLHRALVGIATKRGKPPPELTGRDKRRKPLRGPHRHAHINPLDLNGDGHLDHILIWAPMGLGARAQSAIRTARRTYTKGEIEPLRLAVASSGNLLDMVSLPGIYGKHLTRFVSDGVTVWRSATPFVPPRYLKVRGKNSLEGQICAELQSRGFPCPAGIEIFARPDVRADVGPGKSHISAEQSTNNSSRFRHFILSRRNGPEPVHRRGYAIRLEFNRPVSGPVALGYGSHFGLGLFAACDYNER